MKNLNIPVGISDFEKIRREGFYYIDKTGLVKELLNPKPAEVTLITRPQNTGNEHAGKLFRYQKEQPGSVCRTGNFSQ